MQTNSGTAAIGSAKLYYEIAGEGQPFVMIHAGVADRRQWNHEFAFFANHFRVIRYDMRGFGKSEPAEGEFSHLGDLTALLDTLEIRVPVILMGCSMGGGLAMNFALTQPERVRALIMVGSAPTGLELDIPPLAKFSEVKQAYDAGDLDRVAELETQIWFDGMGRTAGQVNAEMRKLAYEMNRNALSLEAKQLGKRVPDTESSSAERLGELKMPVLVIVGDQDVPYILAAADIMLEKIPSARKVVIQDAAHLSNMEHPEQFQQIVTAFLDTLPE